MSESPLAKSKDEMRRELETMVKTERFLRIELEKALAQIEKYREFVEQEHSQ